jgi:SAM-dependent methyltransferase
LERPEEGARPVVDAADVGRTGPLMARTDLEAVTGQWAGIVFWHSLEHLPDPQAALAQAVDRLMPGGALVIAVPNHESWQARLFGPSWFARDLPRHLAHIPGRALVARLRQQGLTVRRVSYVRGGQVFFGWLDGLVGSLPGGVSLYDAIRAPQARASRMGAGRRLLALIAAVFLAPLALVASVAEVAARRGGTVYVEATR